MKKNKGLVFIFSFVLINASFAQNIEVVTLNFDFDSYDINQEISLKLDSFLNHIRHRRIEMIQLNGHTDSKGSEAYNNVLSLKRAKAIRNYLQAKEIYDSISFIDRGVGKHQLLNTENTEEERSLNRRVEMIVKFNKEGFQTGSLQHKPQRSLAAILNDTLTRRGSSIPLPNLEFEPGSTKFLSTSLPVLRELRSALLNNLKLKIAVEGHICCGTEFVPDVHSEGFTSTKQFSNYLNNGPKWFGNTLPKTASLLQEYHIEDLEVPGPSTPYLKNQKKKKQQTGVLK
ncbi:MAG: OmpA family protein [Ferruginibacter sp.]